MKKKMFIALLLTLFCSSSIVDSFPCPSECLCKTMEKVDVDFTRMSYQMDCRNSSFPYQKFLFNAQPWSIQQDRIGENDDDDDLNDNYVISLDLSNALTLKNFNKNSVELKNFSFVLRSFSLTSLTKHFVVQSNTFENEIYKDLQNLNLSSCCREAPSQCDRLFRPLKELKQLDLSDSNLYQSCLSVPESISPTLRDLYLRNNFYNTSTFSHSSRLFDAVRNLSGHLDLQNSRFQFGSQLKGNCLFDLFRQVTSLDISNVQFDSTSEEISVHLAHLLKCKSSSNDVRNGEQLVSLSLRRLNLQSLPDWFNADRFPRLELFDLSSNEFRSIDIQSFSNLRSVSFASNPLDFRRILWRDEKLYDSINLRSTERQGNFDVVRRLRNLSKLTSNFDYSENWPNDRWSLVDFQLENDFPSSQIGLNLSRMNLKSIELKTNEFQYLDVSWNFLTELNLDDQRELTFVDCSNQQLSKLTLNKDLKTLNQLKCSNNSLRTIENFSLMKMNQLKSIDLSSNSIDSLENLLGNFVARALETILLSSNRIERIRSNCFHRQLISLFHLDLSFNRISTIEKNGIDAPNLQILNLIGNPLKIVEAKSIFTASLRFFDVFNQTDRCLTASNSKENLRSIYFQWFEQNGTFVKTHRNDRNLCPKRSTNPTKAKSFLSKGKAFVSYYFFYVIVGSILIGLFFALLHFHRKKKFVFLNGFQRYKRVDRNQLIDSNLHEDDEIVMNLDAPPFNSPQRPATRV